MRFVVTGGAGFIGSHLVEHLVQEGHDVVVVDDFSTGHRENLAPFLDRITLVEGSVVDPAVCRRAIEGSEYVFHEAAIPSVPRSIRNPVASHDAGATATLNVLVAARDAGVRRVVYAGSSSAYGNTPVLPKREEMPPRPRSPYAVSKLTGEFYCRAFHASYGLETVALRYFNIFGPRQDPNSDYAAVIPMFISCAIAGRRPTIYGDGEQTRDFTYVANAVAANMAACTAPSDACGEVYNVGCGARYSLNHVWRRVQSLAGTEIEPVYAAPRAGDVRDSLASLERSTASLGYRPAVSLDEGLERTFASFVATRP